MVRRIRALLSLLVLLALTVGLPWALAVTVGNPLHQWSSIISGDMSDRDVIAIMAAVAYLAWASFAVAVLVELLADGLAAVSHRPRRRIRIPLLGLQQHLARTLIASMLMLAPAVTAMIGPATPAHGAPPPASAAAQPQHPTSRPPAPATTPASPQDRGTYVVPERDGMRSYWAMAEYYLGNARRWPEIWQLNQGRQQADGSVLTSPNLLRPGWQIIVPAPEPGSRAALDEAAAPKGVHIDVVQPGDTLSGLAAADGIDDWHTVWPMNAGRAEPGGEQFTNPDLIKPGWTIELPNAGAAVPTPPPRTAPTHSSPPGQPPAPHPTQPQPPPPTQTPPTTPAHPSTSPHTTPAVPTATSAPGTTAAPAPTSAPTPAGSASTAAPQVPEPTSADGSGPPAESRPSWETPVVAFTGGGLLLAGVSLTALVYHRRRQFQRRGPGRTISGSPPPLVAMEKAVLTAGPVGVVNVRWLDEALRGLVQAVAQQPGGRLPDVMAARMTDAELTLLLATAVTDPPEPWQASEDGTRWTIGRQGPTGYDAARRDSYFAPFPTLTSVGYSRTGEQWLLDLERIAALSLSGDGQRCLDLARFLAAELALNPWSEMLQVTLVGFGQELVAANPDRLRYTADLVAAATSLIRQFDEVHRALEAADTDVLDGRLHDIIGDQWAPTVTLIAPQAAADTAALDELLTRMKRQPGRAAVALVLADDPDRADAARWRLSVGSDGTLTIPALGVTLTAHGIPAGEAAPLAQMLAYAAVSEDEPVPPAGGEQPWNRYADACGGLTVRPEADEPAPGSATAGDGEPTSARTSTQRRRAGDGAVVPVLGLAEQAPWRGNSVLPLSAQTYLAKSAATAEDLQQLAPVVDEQIRAEVEQSDRTLDADLADWYDESCPRPKLRLLGKPEVRAKGQPPGQLAFHTEVVAFLGTRDDGVSSSEYAQMMWPNDPDVVGKPKVRQSITAVRHWLGVDPETGDSYLPSGSLDTGSGTARYRINKLLCDAELFRRLRLRGVARGRDGIDDLWRALQLVDAPPFHEKDDRRKDSPGGWLWLSETNHRLDFYYSGMIVDVAHTVATYHFGQEEPQRAAAAAQVALRAGAYDDVPLLDLVQACYAQDKDAEADGFIRQLLANWGVERIADLEDRTAEILHRLRRGRRPTAS